MDIKTNVLVALLVALLALASAAMSIDTEDQVESDPGAALEEEKRAQWMPTRELESSFKELVMMSLFELVNEGRLSKSVLGESSKVDKRGRWQGFCFRKTRSGRFLPYICWKGGELKRGQYQGFCFRRSRRTGRYLPYVCWKGGKK